MLMALPRPMTQHGGDLRPPFRVRCFGKAHYYNLISMSTPAGRWSRRWRESTVFGVGW
jgi:hypothetical protein